MSTVIVVGDNGEGDDANAEPVEQVAEVVEAVADVIEEAAPELPVLLDHESRLTRVEDALAIQGAVVAEVAEGVADAQGTADVALDVALDAATPNDVEEAIELTEIVDTDNDGHADEIDAPDEAPPGARSHWLDRPLSEWRKR